ncbi:MAG: hypothetical protein ABIH34_04070 [Nanoarchaeota archaeon]
MGWIKHALPLLFLLSISIVYAEVAGRASFTNPICDDAGSVFFRNNDAIDLSVKAIDPTGEEFEVPGSWDINAFTSDEALFRLPGDYTIIQDGGEKTTTCPGLAFSCSIIDLDVESCKTVGKRMTARFTLEGADPDEMKFQFERENGRTKDWIKDAIPFELQGVTIDAVDDAYVLTTEHTGEYVALAISHPSCFGKNQVYKRVECPIEDTDVDIDGEGLKCGEFSGMRERVACRLRQQSPPTDSLAHYPEECRAASSPEGCLQRYQLMQPCWKAGTGRDRISCVKVNLNLGDIGQENAACNILSDERQETCRAELQEKVHNLIKFRFINMQEEARRLMDQGIVDESKVTDFTVRMEEIILAFEEVDETLQRRTAILEARKAWVEMLKEVVA